MRGQVRSTMSSRGVYLQMISRYMISQLRLKGLSLMSNKLPGFRTRRFKTISPLENLTTQKSTPIQSSVANLREISKFYLLAT